MMFDHNKYSPLWRFESISEYCSLVIVFRIKIISDINTIHLLKEDNQTN